MSRCNYWYGNLHDYRTAGNDIEVSRYHYWYGNWAHYHTGNLSKCHDVITGMVILPISVPVMTSKCHDVITGMVIGPITIPVIF